MGDDEISYSVECYSGASYAQRPSALIWQGERLKVLAIETEWRQPDGKRFVVRVEDGRKFDLFYHEAQDRWEITEI